MRDLIQYRDFIFQSIMPCHYRISLQGISYEVGASRKSLGFRANKKTTFVCKDFEARDSSLNEGSSSFSLKSQRTSSPYYNDSRVWLKSRGTQGLLSSFYPSSSTNIYIYINRLKNLADTFKRKLSPNYLQQAEPCINSNELRITWRNESESANTSSPSLQTV